MLLQSHNGLPQKDGDGKPLYDYQQIIFDSLDGGSKHLWIKKATGLGRIWNIEEHKR